MDSFPTFGDDDLSSILVVAGAATPTRARVEKAVAELYGDGAGPSVSDLLAGGWLVPTIDKQRLRLPPLTQTEWTKRLRAGPPPARAGPRADVSAPPRFSYFEGPITKTTPRAAIMVTDLYKVIVSPPSSLRERARAARAEYEAHGSSERYRGLKKRLDYVSVGGTFTRREDAALVHPSGLLVLDFDGMGGGLAEARAALLSDPLLAPAIALLFVSPSGDGLKVVATLDPRHDRRENYRRIHRYLTHRYGWGPTLDMKTADVSRVCFLSHDPTAWLAQAHQ